MKRERERERERERVFPLKFFSMHGPFPGVDVGGERGSECQRVQRKHLSSCRGLMRCVVAASATESLWCTDRRKEEVVLCDPTDIQLDRDC